MAVPLCFRDFGRLERSIGSTRNRQFNHYACSTRVQIARANLAAVLLDDPVRDAQTESRPLSGAFRREERIENAVEIGETGAIIVEAQLNPVADLYRLHGHTAARNALQSIERIVQNVQKNLL